jgi:hypothetical protein
MKSAKTTFDAIAERKAHTLLELANLRPDDVVSYTAATDLVGGDFESQTDAEYKACDAKHSYPLTLRRVLVRLVTSNHGAVSAALSQIIARNELTTPGSFKAFAAPLAEQIPAAY